MARRTNFGFEKRQRELRKQKKKDDKAERRRLEAEAAESPGEDSTAPETSVEPEPADKE